MSRRAMRQAIRIAALGFLLLWLPVGQGQALQCSPRFPEACQSCSELERAFRHHLFGKPVQRARAVWTPIYAAYFHDCADLARNWLNQGASAFSGGEQGDLLATVVMWDRFGYTHRRDWAKLLVDHGASLDHKGLDGVTTGARLQSAAAAGDGTVARLLPNIESWLGE